MSQHRREWRASKTRRISFWTGLIGSGVLLFAGTLPLVASAESEEAPRRRMRVSEVVESLDNGVVLITCRNSKGARIGLGSGFVIDRSGLVATNYHVIRGASKAEATFVDGTKVQVKGCRAWDAEGDLAILELEKTPKAMKVLKLREDEKRQQAADVIAIGHPEGFKFTTTTGIISAVHESSELPRAYRDFLSSPENYVWIQTNAAISGGNSGGPLLDEFGEVLGINTWIADGQNLGFAIDVRHLLKLRKKCKAETLPLAELTGPEETLADLVGDFNNQYEWFQRELAKANSRDKRRELTKAKHPALDFLPKFWELADKYRKTPTALEALKTVCAVAGAIQDCPPACEATMKRTADRIVEDFGSDPRIIPSILLLGKSRLDEAHRLLERLEKESENRPIQGMCLVAQSVALRSRPDVKDREAKSLAVLERIAKEYPDVEFGEHKLGDLVAPALFALKHLRVGRTPPDIVGEDIDGKKFKLSEYRGKVVVLDFWADWCPHCSRMYPHERELVKRYADAPFVLLGVNSDEPGRLRRVVDSGRVTWRSWADGRQGPIGRQWQIQAVPTIFVLDEKGVIRYINVRGKDLDKAIAELLEEAGYEGEKKLADGSSTNINQTVCELLERGASIRTKAHQCELDKPDTLSVRNDEVRRIRYQRPIAWSLKESKEIAQFPNLEHLNLWNTAMNDEHLEPFSRLKNLTFLNIGGLNPKKTASFRGLAKLGRLGRLRDLHLQGLKRNGGDLTALARFPELRVLSLWRSEVRDEDIQALRNLKHLEVLNLGETAIGDDGLEHLHALKSLRELDVKKSKVTAEGVKKLRESLPQCKIVTEP